MSNTLNFPTYCQYLLHTCLKTQSKLLTLQNMHTATQLHKEDKEAAEMNPLTIKRASRGALQCEFG